MLMLLFPTNGKIDLVTNNVILGTNTALLSQFFLLAVQTMVKGHMPKNNLDAQKF